MGERLQMHSPPSSAAHRGTDASDIEVLDATDAERRQRAFAGGFRAAGLTAGDRVALVTTSGADMLCAVLGALRTGVVPVLTHAGLLPVERQQLFDDAQPSLVVDDQALSALAAAPPADLAPWPLARPMHFTSGTTGTPKGVWSGVLSEADAAALLAEETDLWGFGPNDRHLVCSPMYHSVSIRFAAGTLLAGGTVIMAGAFEATRVASVMAALSPTTTFMVPAHLQRLFALGELPPGNGFRLVVHAGAPCPQPLKRATIGHFGVDTVWEFYGSTEGQCTVASAHDWLEHPGTVGRSRPNRLVSADPDGTLWCEVPRWARFAYWRDPARTAQAWRIKTADPHRFGAFTVGDLGRVDDDGYVWLDGRRDDLVITGGVNVYPAEVEQVLAQAPGVQAVAVFGRDDERWGQRVCCAVVGDVDTDVLAGWARQHLGGHKRPKEYHVVAELPHTATGKLQRRHLDALCPQV